MAKTTAQVVRHRAALAEEFGLNYATKLFGADALAALPRYQRGKNAGKLKGAIVWIKAERGGWHYEYGVCRPGLVRAWIVAGYDGNQGDAVTGMFHGRVQNLCASASMLGEANRAAEAARQAAEATDRAAQIEELRAEGR